jgi:CRISPR/Cas system CSM-associated protein Csm3 (group 7 of RAMP superfamily)
MTKNNPYDFVPLGPAADRLAIATQEKFAGHSGTLTCRLQTLTHFFIAGNQERQARNQHQELRLLREDNAPIIPGSSLKGAIRHLAEALSGSCFILPNDPRMRSRHKDKLEYYDYQTRRRDAYPLPEGFSPCGLGETSDPRQQTACPACRIFGFLADRVLSTGNTGFETARVSGDHQATTIILEPFGAPAPRHRPFYGTKASNFQEPRGRKFYYHRLQGARMMSQKLAFNKTVEALQPGAVFEFTVQYQNLRDAELSLLIYALALEEPMRHKLGMGKGVGLGSVHLTITGWRQTERRQRYLQFGGGTTNLSGVDLQNAVNAQIDAYHRHYARWKDSLAALKDILTWDEQHPRDARYPAREWLKKNPAVALEDVPQDAADFGKRPATAAPRPFAPTALRPEQEKAAAEAKKDADNLLRQLAKEKQSDAVQRQTAYQNNATEQKAQAELSADGAWFVVLPKLPEQRVKLIRKPGYSKAVAGAKLRVRVVVDGNGNIVRAEEL